MIWQWKVLWLFISLKLSSYTSLKKYFFSISSGFTQTEYTTGSFTSDKPCNISAIDEGLSHCDCIDGNVNATLQPISMVLH